MRCLQDSLLIAQFIDCTQQDQEPTTRPDDDVDNNIAVDDDDEKNGSTEVNKMPLGRMKRRGRKSKTSPELKRRKVRQRSN